MYQKRVAILTIIGLLFVIAACTPATTQAPDETPTAAVDASATPEPTELFPTEPADASDASATPEATLVVTAEPTAAAPEETVIEPDGPEAGGVVELLDELRSAGATVESDGQVQQPFFTASGQLFRVNGESVQLFEYPDRDAAAAEAELISPDGSSVGTSMMQWIATPHFYARNRLIALYVGDDAGLVGLLNQVLGQPLAEGQTVLGPPLVAAKIAHPAGTRTGIAELDAIIEAVLGDDDETLRSLTQYTLVGCTHADGLGGPPKCEEGEEEGTILEVVPFLGSEGSHLRRAEFELWPGPDVKGLLAAYRVSENVYSDEAYPAGEFALVFLGPNEPMDVTIQVSGGRVVRYDFKFGSSLEEELSRDAAEIILPPFGGQPLPAPEASTVASLEDALAAGDFGALEGLMGDSFAIGYWRSEGQFLTPAEAVEQLHLNLLPDPTAVSFIRDRAGFPDLGGIDPATLFGPAVQIVDLVYSQGWGSDGLGEAILTIAQYPDGSQYWHGIIYSLAGFG